MCQAAARNAPLTNSRRDIERPFKIGLHAKGGVAGLDARRAAPSDPERRRWGLAGCRQFDPSTPGPVTANTVNLNQADIERGALFTTAIKARDNSDSSGGRARQASDGLKGRNKPAQATPWGKAGKGTNDPDHGRRQLSGTLLVARLQHA